MPYALTIPLTASERRGQLHEELAARELLVSRGTHRLMTTDEERRAWWPELYAVTAELRALGRHDIADDLDRSVAGSATSSELLGNVGLVLRRHDVQRSRLGPDGRGAWDRIMRDVNRNDPLRAFAYRMRRAIWP